MQENTYFISQQISVLNCNFIRRKFFLYKSTPHFKNIIVIENSATGKKKGFHC